MPRKTVQSPMKPNSPQLEKREERDHKDLDGDGEKGEPFAHQKKVLGVKKATALDAPKKPIKRSK